MRSNSKKKILFLFLTRNNSLVDWNVTGTLNRELKLYLELANHFKWNLVLFSYGNELLENVLLTNNVSVFAMPKWLYEIRPRRVRNFLHLMRFVFYYFGNEGIIQSNQLSGSTNAIICAKFLNMPFVLRMGFYYTHFLGYTIKKFPPFLEKIVFNNSAKLIVSNPLAKQFIHKFLNHQKDVHYIPNYVDVDTFFPQRKVYFEYDFIYVGRFDSRKGSEYFISLLDKYRDKKFLLITNTRKLSSEKFANYKNLIVKSNIPNEELPVYFSSSIFMVAYSEYEGCPKSYLEAAACGCSLIYRDVPGMSEFFNDFNWLNQEKIFDFEGNSNFELRLSRHEKISAEFSYNKVLFQFVNLYKELLNEE